MLGDHSPERPGIWRACGRSLIENGRCSMQQRRIDGIAVTNDPSDVRGGPVDLSRLDSVEMSHRPFQRDHMAAVVTHDAFRLTSRARRIKDIKGVGGRQGHAIGALSGPNGCPAQRCPIVISLRYYGRL